MIDDPDQVERLLARLRQALPLPARMTPGLLAALRDRAPGRHPTRACRITAVDYAGDEGGIVCHLEADDDVAADEVVVASITHLDFDAKLPLAREITAYQKHRIKRLRRIGP
jgi:hypothetical protein